MESDPTKTTQDLEPADGTHSGEWFRQLVEYAPHAMVVVDASGRIRLVNAQVLAWFGYAREEVLGQAVELLIPERFRAKHPALLQAFIGSPSLRPMGTGRDLYARRKDGSEFPVDISLSPIRTRVGLRVVASIADMTERKRTETALQRSNLAMGSANEELEKLRAKLADEVAERANAEARFRQLVELAPHAMVIVGADGTIRLVNSQAIVWFGYSREELVGQPVEILIPERFRKFHATFLAGYFREPSLRPMGSGRELAGRRKDGSELPVDISLSPVQTPEGLQVIASIADISERRKTEDSLRQAHQRMEAVNKELETFAYSVSHDLRAPLRSMIGFANILLEDLGDRVQDEQKAYLVRISRAGARMGQLIDDMLTLSRVTRSELKVERVDLSALACGILEELKRAEPRRPVLADVRVGLTDMADKRQVTILLDNLLRNAWKFSSKTIAPKIEVGSVPHEKTCAYFVRDNGAGFDMAFASKLFGAFQRLHDVDEFPGSGVGLATAQRVVNRHGGKIWAEGKVGAGATFYFTLGG